MRVVAKTGREDIAVAYVAETAEGKLIEFVESVQPPIPRDQKWVLIVSTLHGCPVACRFCDAGGHYRGGLTYDEIATTLHIPRGTVMSRLHRARVRLKEAVRHAMRSTEVPDA